MAPPAGKDFPKLRADAAFKKLSPAHQDLLLEFCRSGVPFTPEVREGDAVLLCDSLVKVEEVVRETLLQKVKEDSRRFRRMIGMSGTASFERPKMNNAPAAGAEVATCQRRLIQVFAMLSDTETRLETSSNHDRKKLVTNTIEWFIFSGLPLEFATTTDGSLMGEYVPTTHRMILYHESLLKIGPDKLGDPRETLRKLAHEVNHACRRDVEDADTPEVRLIDEFHAYLTELIAHGETVTESQVNQTFQTLSDPPYNLKKVVNSPAGVGYRQSIKYQGGTNFSSNNVLIFPVPAPGTATVGWHHTNAVPGL